MDSLHPSGSGPGAPIPTTSPLDLYSSHHQLLAPSGPTQAPPPLAHSQGIIEKASKYSAMSLFNNNVYSHTSPSSQNMAAAAAVSSRKHYDYYSYPPPPPGPATHSHYDPLGVGGQGVPPVVSSAGSSVSGAGGVSSEAPGMTHWADPSPLATHPAMSSYYSHHPALLSHHHHHSSSSRDFRDVAGVMQVSSK